MDMLATVRTEKPGNEPEDDLEVPGPGDFERIHGYPIDDEEE